MQSTDLASSEFPIDFGNTLRLNPTYSEGTCVLTYDRDGEDSREVLTSQHLW